MKIQKLVMAIIVSGAIFSCNQSTETTETVEPAVETQTTNTETPSSNGTKVEVSSDGFSVETKNDEKDVKVNISK